MKKALLIIGAVTVMLAGFASQSFAGTRLDIGFISPLPGLPIPVPVLVHEPAHERFHRDFDGWDHRHWGHDDWRRDRAERHWGDAHWDRARY
ncbi:MAG TPA: hypothetical protein VK452_12230 [Dissulfurispiraceae bacterium]|nr:hypothetical protein [Dissulfurispiraceae bacterium]